jgi:hypothetical protein
MTRFFTLERIMPLGDRIERRHAAVPTLFMLTMAAAGCSGLLDSSQNYAENAQIIVTGTSPVPMLLILSNRYTAIADQTTGNITVQIEQADTLELSLPIDRTYPLGDQFRILARLQNADSTSTASINMRVLLDGKDEVYNQNATMKDSYLEYRFSYF